MATSWFGPWRMEIQKMDFPDPNYQIDLSIFADFSFIFQNEKKWKCAKEFLQRCKIVGVSPKEFIAILTARPGQVQFGLLDWNRWEPKHGSIFNWSQFLLRWGKTRKRALQYQLDLHPPLLPLEMGKVCFSGATVTFARRNGQPINPSLKTAILPPFFFSRFLLKTAGM